MKKNLLLLCCLLSLVITAKAQYNQVQNKVWAMSQYTGLDFRAPGMPGIINTNFYSPSGERAIASLADTNGMVLYTNGTTVWDSLHQVMPHGAGINGAGLHTEQAMQGALIVPVLTATSKFTRYYIFSLEPSSTPGRLFCNVVDLEKNNGLGDIDTSFYLHHIPIDSALSDKMIAIPGCDRNIWVLVHTRIGSVYKAYEITLAGINLTPVISNSGLLPPGGITVTGTLKSSPGGDRILNCSGMLEIAGFDRSTGMVGLGVALDTIPTFGYYGGDFSPDGTKVYACPSLGGEVFQFDLAAANPAATKTLVGNGLVGGSADLKLAPDHKIYFISNSGYYGGARYLGRINTPNNAGSACGFQDSVAALYFPYNPSPNRTPRGHFPNVVIYPSQEPSFTARLALDSLLCPFPSSGVLLEAPGYSDYIWDNGSAGSSRNMLQPGICWVKYKLNSCTYRTDTFRIKGTLPVVITLNNDTLSTTISYNTYQWYKGGQLLPGATNRKCPLSGNGLYAVKVSDANGCTDSATYQVGPTNILTPQELQKAIRIYPNPARNLVHIVAPVPVDIILVDRQGRELLRSGKSFLDIGALANGLYFLQVYDKSRQLIKVEKLTIHHEE